MAKPEWGTKRICHGCGARFYDLNRDPILCPKCGTEFDPEALLRSRKIRTTGDSKIKPRKQAEAPETREDEVDLEAAEESEEDGLIENTEDLEDDESDMPSLEGDEDENT